MTITISLVKVGNVYRGQTASDRWNMLQMGLGHTIAADRNQTAIKRLRREWGTEFTFKVSRSSTITWMPSITELKAFGQALPLVLTRMVA